MLTQEEYDKLPPDVKKYISQAEKDSNMSDKKDDVSGLGCIGAIFILTICVAHNLIFTPYIGMNIYNWYLAEFIGRGSMDWHVAFGVACFVTFYLRFIAKEKLFDTSKDTVSICATYAGYTFAMWLVYGVAWFFKGWNLFQ